MSARVTHKRARTEEEGLPPAKREPGRNEDGATGAASAHGEDGEGDGRVFKKDDEFWFDDGTVILVAGDVEFRVYEGLLASHSSVLKDLFAERHPLRTVNGPEQRTTSCPVIHVSDSPEDLLYLLCALFAIKIRSLYSERDPSWHEISASIRLGHKYKVKELYTQSLDYLKRHFPGDFVLWVNNKDYVPPTWKNVEAISVINLARLTGELSMLPSAFIACIAAASEVMGGVTREDGSKEILTLDDLSVCVDGNNRMREATITAILRTFNPTVSPECKTQKACKTALRDVLQDLETHVSDLANGFPFLSHTTFLEGGKPFGACGLCQSMVEQRNAKEHKDMWDRLPELLGLEIPAWVPPAVPSTQSH